MVRVGFGARENYAVAAIFAAFSRTSSIPPTM
jgi:hypothetical protein